MKKIYKNQFTSTEDVHGELSIKAAKKRLNIFDLWRRLGIPGLPDICCCSPFRPDGHPSFSIYMDGTRWFDHATGEGGDAIDFLGKAAGITNRAAVKLFIRLARNENAVPAHTEREARSHNEKAKKAMRATWPSMRVPTDEDCMQIAKSRGLSASGVRYAAISTFVRMADLQEGRVFVVVSGDGTNAQARLLTGETFAGGKKAKTLPGAVASRPIGLPVGGQTSSIALCEGGPDFLAAYDLVLRMGLMNVVAPVAMLGAGLRIPTDLLAEFSGKRVRIFSHNDDAGRRATEQWSQQLSAAGATVDSFSFDGLCQADGTPVKDLNDFLLMAPDDFAKHSPAAVSFVTEKRQQDAVKQPTQNHF